MPDVGIYAWSHGGGGVHFHRMAEPLRVMAANGHNANSGNMLHDEILERHDTVLVHMLWEERATEAWEKLAKIGQHRLVFDIDDVMWAPDWKPFKDHYTPEILDRVWRNIKLAHVVTTPSPYIAEHVAQFNSNVWVCPNSVPESLLKRRPRVGQNVVGYQGSPSHLTDVTDGFRRDLGKFLVSFPDWNIHLWGADPKDEPFGGRVKHVPWKSSVRDYYRSVAMDIGLGPLADTPFNAGKSALRAVEYAALGIPAVLQDGRSYRGWVVEGVTGYLVPPGGSWFEILRYLAESPELRVSMSRAGRIKAQEWTTEAQINWWTSAWNSV